MSRHGRTLLCGLAVVLLASAAHAQVTQPDPETGVGQVTPEARSPRELMASLSAETTRELAAMDARLDALVAAMERARGPAKVDAVAAVVVELVAQRKAMRDLVLQPARPAPDSAGPDCHEPGAD